ncbi:MAG: 1,4-alpha-glucan branching protein GlgB [Proteobacteria bacterium]|nr:1,4-alpha-glucan branching protein GlgB [Pseudomonadota bacterium]MBU1709268.1 1,4-alpha-glucan branching protein GlgB [Pseudomonadota bacterium]
MSTIVEKELERIIKSDQHDPFQVLGLHIINQSPPEAIIRTFQPHASSVRVLANDQSLDMYKMRSEGLFELIITGYTEPFDYFLEITSFDNSRKTFKDPYRYLPQLSEFDRHLFNAGNHYQIFEKLGAHTTTIDGVDGTIFRVWAPSARRVSVIGDFNWWDGRVHQMRSLGGSGIWELFIPGIKHGEAYKYEIRAQDMSLHEKADPYQFFSELRPKTASIVWDLNTYSWQDEEWINNRDRSTLYKKPFSIYEMHLGSWQRDPGNAERFLTYRELAKSLIPYIKEMGFTHIELMPIMEHPYDESWGYQTTGYFSVTSRHGTPQDFMYFVDCCHQNGIGVLLDWAPAHFPTDGHALGRFDGSHLYEHQHPQEGMHPEWGTLIFNYGRNEVRNFLIANALFWLDKFHIDGLRVDAVASMLYKDYGRKDKEWIPNPYGGKENIEAIEFLRHLNSVLYERFPGAMTIAEESTSFYGVSRPADQGGLGFGFKWNMGWMNDMLTFFSKDPIYRKHHHNSLTFSLLYAFTESFILPLSHDEVVHGKRSLLAKMPGDPWQQFANLRLLFFFMWTHPGKKLLFMGGEFGQYSEWYCKVSLDWHLMEHEGNHRRLHEFVKTLNHFYRNEPALWEDDFSFEGFKWMDFKDVDNSIIAFARFANNKNDHLVCVLNFTPQAHHGYKLGVPSDRKYREVFCSDLTSFGGTDVKNPTLKDPIHEAYGEAPYHVLVSIPPLGGIILKPE